VAFGGEGWFFLLSFSCRGSVFLHCVLSEAGLDSGEGSRVSFLEGRFRTG